MSTEALYRNIEFLCGETVSHLIKSFQNPEMQGPNFTWERFHEMVAEHCKKQVTTLVQFSDNKQQEEALQYAYAYGKFLSEEHVRNGSL